MWIMNNITQMFNNTSAMLNIGKSNIGILTKSLTPPIVILSIRFPIVPAVKKLVINPVIYQR